MSRLFEDQPRSLHLANPVRALDRHDRRRIGRGWDPRKTPFLKTKADVRSLYLALPELARGRPFRAMFAVGALAGLRPGEVRALEWADLDFGAGLIHVQRSAEGPTKDDQSRHVPIASALAAMLKEWRRCCPLGAQLVFPASGSTGRYVDEDAFRRELRRALEAARLPPLMVYQATRHSFGAQWVKNGGSLVKLAATLGHSNTEVTARYGHLVPGEFSEADRALVDLDLEPAAVLPLTEAQ